MNKASCSTVIRSVRVLPIVIASLVFSAGMPALAQSSYQYENSIVYQKYKIDTSSDEDYDNWGIALAGATYFAQVDTTRGPLAEAAFLNRASGVNLVYSRTETDNSWTYQDEDFRTEARTDAAVLNINYYVPETIFYVSLGVAADKSKYSSSITRDGTRSAHRYNGEWDYQGLATLGVTPLNNLLIWSNFYEGQDVGDHWNLNGKYVWLFQGERALNIELGYEQEDEDDEKITRNTISTDYYFNKSFSVGLAYHLSAFEYIDDQESSEIRARKFFGESVSVQASYTEMDDEQMVLIGGSYRF